MLFLTKKKKKIEKPIGNRIRNGTVRYVAFGSIELHRASFLNSHNLNFFISDKKIIALLLRKCT